MINRVYIRSILLIFFIYGGLWAVVMHASCQAIHRQEGLQEHIVTTCLFLEQCLLRVKFAFEVFFTFIFFIFRLFYSCIFLFTLNFLRTSATTLHSCLCINNFIEVWLKSCSKVRTRLHGRTDRLKTSFSYHLKYVLPACDLAIFSILIVRWISGQHHGQLGLMWE